MSLAVQEGGLRIGSVAPDFEADTTEGHIKFHEWIGDSWAVIFSHPKDFRRCTTELGYMAKLKPSSTSAVKIIGLSVDPVTSHSNWAEDIRRHRDGAQLPDDRRHRSIDLEGLRHAASRVWRPRAAGRMDNMTVRTVFVIGPDKKIKLMISCMTTGRSFDEVLRVIDSLQLTAKHRVAARELEAGRRRDHRRLGLERRGEGNLSDGWKEPKPYPDRSQPGSSAVVGAAFRRPPSHPQ
jgi:alkyl hydroperoxide reductase subunit AhpC